MKRCFTSLIMKDRQVKTTVRHHLIPVRIAVIKKRNDSKCCEDVDTRQLLCIVVGVINWCNNYAKWNGVSLKKLKTELSYDPEIPLLSIYPKKMKILTQKDLCMPRFTAALFTIAKKTTYIHQ